MRRSLRKLAVERLAKPLLQRYLRRETTTQFLELRLRVPAGVFHPAFFFSSRTFARFLSRQPLAKLRVLDLGTGSGVLALVCARKGAAVVAVDIHPEAVAIARRNATDNGLPLDVRLSDQFAAVADERFDLVIVNPPYFQADPDDNAGRAWNAGAQFEYFERLFGHCDTHLQRDTAGRLDAVWMILADNCDIEQISAIARRFELHLKVIHTEIAAWERQFIFALERVR